MESFLGDQAGYAGALAGSAIRRTWICLSRSRVLAMSYADCMRMSVSIFTPKAFSMRSAMSPERDALPFSRLDSAGRETFSAAAAAVTDSPAGWMISVRMKSPGWGGFFMGMMGALSSIVVLGKV